MMDIINETQINWYIQKLHEAAACTDGTLIAMAIWPAQHDGGRNRTEHKRFPVGDIGGMVEQCLAWARDGANVYTSWAVYRQDTPLRSRGKAEHVLKVLGLVADRDADDGKAGERVVEPTIEIISSRIPDVNTNEVLLLAESLDPGEAIPIGRGLRAAMGADSGTGDIVRLTRIPGTINVPNMKKVRERGRPAEPQQVSIGDGGTDERIALDVLIAAIEAATGKSVADFQQASGVAQITSTVRGRTSDDGDNSGDWHNAQELFDGLPEFLQTKIRHNDDGDRSKHCFNVIMLLMEQGFLDEEIASVLCLHPDGAASKFIDRDDLSTEIERCREKYATDTTARASIIESPARSTETAPIDPQWPKPKGPMFHGITGDIVRLATANSEADPVAVAVTHLVWAGAAFGRTRFLPIGDDNHHARLFSVIVGESSRARKGTSTKAPKRIWDRAFDYLEQSSQEAGGNLAPEFSKLNVSSGPMSSGEGIIFEIRDGESFVTNGEWDLGVPDKRLLIIEGEFGAVLRAAQRSGNTLSTMLRSAWDGTNLAPIVKHCRISATDPHVCIVGHITVQELNALLSSVDIFNGFANRILWMLVRRSKLVAIPEPMPDAEVDKLAQELARLMTHARSPGPNGGCMRMTNHAADYWATIYPELTQDHPGVFGVITSRAEAQALRLALTFAQLDGEEMIGEQHIEAALACIRYSADSVGLIFGDADPDPDANKVLTALKKNGPMSQTEMGNLFGRHKNKAQLASLLERLEADGRIKKATRPTAGRSAAMWSLRA